jgi:hypothetical protein
MNPLWADLLRKNAPVLAALLVFLGFTSFHAVAVRPLLVRYRDDVRQAVELGMPLDGSTSPVAASASVLALFNANSLDPADAEERGTSGALTAALLDQAARLAAERGLEVRATEQGLVTQLPASVQVRAHLRLRGTYAGFVSLLGDLGRSHLLVAVDRFAIQGGEGSSRDIDVWLSQLILKRTRSAR